MVTPQGHEVCWSHSWDNDVLMFQTVARVEGKKSVVLRLAGWAFISISLKGGRVSFSTSPQGRQESCGNASKNGDQTLRFWMQNH
jgi:hypothetical protein